MKRIYFLIFVALLSISHAFAGNKLTNKDLAGTWKITDVKISNTGNSENSVTVENCYFSDLYRAKLGLVFTESGQVDYNNYGNPTPGRYELKENLIYFFSAPADGESIERVEFAIKADEQTLTLTKISPAFTETYTFTK